MLGMERKGRANEIILWRKIGKQLFCCVGPMPDRIHFKRKNKINNKGCKVKLHTFNTSLLQLNNESS
jgi:hypothetical protein